MTTKPLIALDIGSTKVACAIGLPHEQTPGFELLGSSIVAYPLCSETWLGDPLMVSRTIEQALDASAVTGDLDRAFVVMNHPQLVSEQATASITLADEPIAVRAQDLDRLQTSALHHVLGIDREPLLVERLGCSGNGFEHVRDPRGLTATRLRGLFHVLTMPLAARRALIQAVESAGLEVMGISFTQPAALASLSDERFQHQRVLVLDVGGVSTDIGLFGEGVLTSVRVVAWGGVTLATMIAKELRVTMDQALAWGIEGTSCRREEVRTLLERRWDELQTEIDQLLAGQPRPDALLVTGRGALVDGFVERIERATGIPTSLCRSPRTSRLSDVSRQVGLSAAIGVLELNTRMPARVSLDSPRLFNRLIDRTKTILTEYF